MISIENVLKRFDTTIAIDINNLVINQGDILGLIGNNGAGKTTLLRLILDLLKPERGRILSKGNLVYQSEHWKSYTSSFIDNNFLIDFLTPEEYFSFIAELYNVEEVEFRKRLEIFNTFMHNEILGQGKYIRHLSSGNKHKVGIIGAFLSGPEILILDEPFNFLDPSSQIILKKIVKSYQENFNTTIVISSHNLNHVADLCTHIALMEKGRIIKDIANSQENMKDIESYFASQSNL